MVWRATPGERALLVAALARHRRAEVRVRGRFFEIGDHLLDRLALVSGQRVLIQVLAIIREVGVGRSDPWVLGYPSLAEARPSDPMLSENLVGSVH